MRKRLIPLIYEVLMRMIMIKIKVIMIKILMKKYEALSMMF